MIISILSVFWIAVQIYAFTSPSSPNSLTHQANDKGELCGGEENEGRGNLLYFDISKCAGLQARGGYCKTAQASMMIKNGNNRMKMFVLNTLTGTKPDKSSLFVSCK